MDVAAEHLSSSARGELSENRVQWGSALRVVDIELARLNMASEEEANVLVDVTWVRADESVMRQTRLHQVWKNPDGDWKLTEERRVSGANGLLGPAVVVLRPPRPRDVHLPSKTLR